MRSATEQRAGDTPFSTTIRHTTRRSMLMAVLFGCAAGAAGIAPARAAPAQESAVAPEKNPPGDIPDDQVFVTYQAPQGFTLKVPEGWARTDNPSGVTFADKYGTVAVSVAPATAAPTAAAVKAAEAADLVKAGRAVKIAAIDTRTLPGGQAVRIAYTSNSEPNPVTDKRIRLENERFLIGGAGKLATLTLSAPAGADNADQWKLIADSFRWR